MQAARGGGGTGGQFCSGVWGVPGTRYLWQRLSHARYTHATSHIDVGESFERRRLENGVHAIDAGASCSRCGARTADAATCRASGRHAA